MALKIGDIQLSKQHPSVRILITTKLLLAVASKQSWNCIEMLSMEEKKSVRLQFTKAAMLFHIVDCSHLSCVVGSVY